MPVNVLIQLRNAGKYYLKAAQRICRASLLCLPAFCSVASRGSSLSAAPLRIAAKEWKVS